MSPTPSPAPLRLGIAGLGTVGIGVVKIVQNHPDLIALRSGRPVQIIYAGKAHPRDDAGKAFIQRVWQLSHDPRFNNKIIRFYKNLLFQKGFFIF